MKKNVKSIKIVGGCDYFKRTHYGRVGLGYAKCIKRKGHKGAHKFYS